MPDIQIGLKGKEEMFVGRSDLASMMGNIGAEVLSTHRVILLKELAVRNAIKESLPEGKMTVGTFIRILHALPMQVPPVSDPTSRPAQIRPGLFVCGEYQNVVSIQWAMVSGRQAVEAV
jgi:hypothetical protein